MIQMDKIINFELITNPVNWIIVALMMAISAFAIAYIMAQTGSGGFAENTL